ncbi:MAG: twin-arginine translocase subunit TatC [Ardenticatenia bacterium]|nr:MAG: twin-arginine translocase subunit TatC [Ardenticatenia bacterium]
MVTPSMATSEELITSEKTEIAEAEDELGPRMTLLEHLRELRDRLIRIVLSLVVATAIGFIFSDYLIDILAIPIGGRMALEAIDVTENMGVFMRVSLLAGVTIAMPFVLYQVLAFIVPGLTKSERRLLWYVLPGATVLFIGGVLFCYFLMLPVAVPFLINFLGIPTKPRPSTYFGFVTRMMLWIGASFEMPLIIAFLSRIGIITPQALSKFRRYAIVLIAVVAAVITPTVDPVNMGLVMAPLLVLYELGVFLSRIMYRKRQPRPMTV